MVNRLELRMRVVREDEIMMQQLFILAIKPEIEHHARAGRLVRAPALEPRGGRRSCEQLTVRPHRIGIGDDRGQRHPLSVLGLDSGNPARLIEQDGSHGGARPEFDAELDGQAGKSLGNRPRAAHWIPQPLARLHVGDAAEHGRRGLRRRADILGEVVEHLGHAPIGDMRADGLGKRPPGPGPEHIGEQLRVNRLPGEYFARRAYRPPEEIVVGDRVHSLGQTEKPAIALIEGPPGCKCRQGIFHCDRVGVKVEDRAVVKERPPLRVEPDELEDVAEVAAGLGEDPREHRRHQENRRPHVEAEPGGFKHVGLAAAPAPPLEDNHIVTAGRQGAGSRQAAQTRADDPDAAGLAPFLHYLALIEHVITNIVYINK